MSQNHIPPFIIVDNNKKVVGISETNRKPMFENAMCESVGLIAVCNCCDRIIFEDENWKSQYIENHGYCKQCV